MGIKVSDAISLMEEQKTGSVDLVLTDIPYGIPELGADLVSFKRGYLDSGRTHFDLSVEEKAEVQNKVNEINFDLDEVVDEAIRISSGWVIIFCAREQMSRIFLLMEGHGIRRALTWEKTNPTPFNGHITYLADIETIVALRKSKAPYNAHCKSSIFRYPIDSSKKYPYFARKPIPLLKELILDTTNEGDTVCDPFCGSGTTAAACIETNRKFICGDISPEAVKLSKRRIADTTGALFG